MELDIPLHSIPTTSSRVIELTPDAQEIARIFADLEDLSVEDASTFGGRLRVQRVGDSVRVAGQVWVSLRFECGRCLTLRQLPVRADLEYLVMPRSAYEATYGKVASSQDDDDGLQLAAADLDVSFYEDRVDVVEIDLRPFLREAVLLEIPSFATCSLVGLDEECDKAYEALHREAFADKQESKIADPRWAPLLALQEQRPGQGDKKKKN